MQTPSSYMAAAAVLAVSAAPVFAQDLLPKAAPQDHPILLRGATLHTVSGEVHGGGDLLFADGKIQSVAKGKLKVDLEGLEVIDASGKHVMPGFVLATSTLGLVEVESVDMTIDTTEAGTVKPEVYAAVAVNPDSWWLPVARRNGVLVAGVFPQGGLVPGRASVMELDGWTWEDMAIERDGGLSINWPSSGSSRFQRFRGGSDNSEERIASLDRLFDAAAAYVAGKAKDKTIATDLRFESMRSVMNGQRHVYLSVTTEEQADAAITWAVGKGLKPAIVGGRDALRFASLLKRHDVPVAITGTHRLPHRRDLSHRTTYQLPAQLEEAGVRWCLTMRARDSANARNLVYEAAAAVAHGLSSEAALRSITLAPAEFLGIADRVGSLEPGKHATMILADGHPFELTSKIERAWIQGREIVLEDKQTALYAKYREKYRQQGKLK